MRPKPYPDSKKTYLRERPSELLGLLLSLPLKQQQEAARLLPPVDGFRTGQALELHERLKRFFARIRRWSDSDWAKFQTMWGIWIRSNTGLSNILLGIDNSSDFADDAPTPPNSALDINCFEKLVQASAEGKVSRETIDSFYRFGYFVEDERIEKLIRLARSEVELRLPLELHGLKDRISQTERAVESLTGRLESQARNLAKWDDLSTRLAALERRLPDLLRVADTVMGLKVEIDRVTTEAKSQAARRAAEIERDLKNLRTDFTLNKEAITDCQTQLHEQKEIVSRALDELQGTVAGLMKQVEELHDTDIAAYHEVVPSSPFPGTRRPAVEPNATHPQAAGNGSTIELAPLRVSGEIAAIHTLDELLERLSENLRAIGIQSQSAYTLAREVLAGALSGQVVLFRGTFGPIVAEACATTLAGYSSFRVQIPVGLLDGSAVSSKIDTLIDQASQDERLVAVVFHGINLAAPEVYAPRISRLVAERLLGVKDSPGLVVFGSVASGVAALPLSTVLCEFGPIFDVDCIGWRDRKAVRQFVSGWVSLTGWQSWSASIPAPSEERWEQAWEAVSPFAGRTTPLWRRMAFSATAILDSLNPTGEPTSVIQSLMYGWAIPWALATTTDVPGRKHLLPKGVISGPEADKRLLQLLGPDIEGVID